MRPQIMAVTSTAYPTGYNKSIPMKGYNKWMRYVHAEVFLIEHGRDTSWEVNRVIKNSVK
jgi:hypothetical protein